jgi:hypothetical protein
VVEYNAVSRLGKIAELNFCHDCYNKYLALVEPTIKLLLARPLGYWRETEADITQMVMKHKKVFTDDKILGVYLSRGEKPEEWITNGIDIKTYREIERWGCKSKLKYLRKHGVLEDASYRLLDTARNLRNNIHDLTYDFPDQDYFLFWGASFISKKIWHLFNDKTLGRSDFWTRFKPSVEKEASAILIRYRNWKK